MAFPLIPPKSQWVDSNGEVLSGGALEFRDPTTDLLKNTYPTRDDADGQSNPNTNPVVLDSRGEAAIFLEDGETYKVSAYETVGGTLLWTVDDVQCPLSGDASTVTITDSGGYYVATNVEAALQELGSSSGAGIIGLLDASGNYAADDVEGALAEIFTEFGSTGSGKGAALIGTDSSTKHVIGNDVQDALEKQVRRNEVATITGDAIYNNTTTLTTLATGISLQADTVYGFRGVVWATQNVGGLKLQVNCTQAPSGSGFIHYRAKDQTAAATEGVVSGLQSIISITTMTNSDEFVVYLDGYFTSNASTGGSLDLRAAQVAGSANSTIVRGGSYFEVREALARPAP